MTDPIENTKHSSILIPLFAFFILALAVGSAAHWSWGILIAGIGMMIIGLVMRHENERAA